MRHLTVPDSDIIESIGYKYDARNMGTLEIVFKSSPNDVYSYPGVDTDTFAQLVSAESIGKKFHEEFRKTKHPFTKSARVSPTLRKSER